MTIRISINGEIGDQVTARIPVLDRGFLYGDSVYEVMRTYGGNKPFALQDHLDRLEHSAALIGIRLPTTRSTICGEIERVIAAAANDETYIRVIISRGEGPITLDPASATNPTLIVIATPLALPCRELYDRGAKAITVESGRSGTGAALAGGAKNSNYLSNILALRQARTRAPDANEAILVDANNRISEGATSNIFIVNDQDEIVTPPLSSGILEGITRRYVIRLLKAEGLAVQEYAMEKSELYRSREVFITGTVREIMPLSMIDERIIGDGIPGPRTRWIQSAWRRVLTGEA